MNITVPSQTFVSGVERKRGRSYTVSRNGTKFNSSGGSLALLDIKLVLDPKLFILGLYPERHHMSKTVITALD